MVGRVLSKRVQQQQQRRLINAKYQSAVDEYNREQLLPEGTKRQGYRVIAKKHGVNYRTLNRLVEGGVLMSAFNAAKCRLSLAEERILVDFILASADCACPLSLSNIEEHANEIIAGRDNPGEPVGTGWVRRFLDHYRDEVKTHWSSPLATERARSLRKDAVEKWFQLVHDEVIAKGIKPHNIYGMDESGFPPAHTGMERVVGRCDSKHQHKTGNANRENVTAIVTICTDGSTLRPTIIFKAQHHQEQWADNNVSGASICVSENGWTDGELALQWVKTDFNDLTKEKAAGETRVLFMDGHNSHFSADLLEFCMKNNIEVLGYPPHYTHALQGLDVVCFAKMRLRAEGVPDKNMPKKPKRQLKPKPRKFPGAVVEEEGASGGETYGDDALMDVDGC